MRSYSVSDRANVTTAGAATSTVSPTTNGASMSASWRRSLTSTRPAPRCERRRGAHLRDARRLEPCPQPRSAVSRERAQRDPGRRARRCTTASPPTTSTRTTSASSPSCGTNRTASGRMPSSSSAAGSPRDVQGPVGRNEVHRRRADEARDEPVGRLVPQLIRCAHLLELAFPDHGDAVARARAPRPGRA